ncbi:unnamed protein product [Diamesa serratosioi]
MFTTIPRVYDLEDQMMIEGFKMCLMTNDDILHYIGISSDDQRFKLVMERILKNIEDVEEDNGAQNQENIPTTDNSQPNPSGFSLENFFKLSI